MVASTDVDWKQSNYTVFLFTGGRVSIWRSPDEKATGLECDHGLILEGFIIFIIFNRCERTDPKTVGQYDDVCCSLEGYQSQKKSAKAEKQNSKLFNASCGHALKHLEALAGIVSMEN